MTRLTGVARLNAAAPADHHDAQNFFGGVRDRRERVGGQHRQSRDARQALVVSVCSGNGAADKQPLQARKGSDGHATLPSACEVSCRARGWKSSFRHRDHGSG